MNFITTYLLGEIRFGYWDWRIKTIQLIAFYSFFLQTSASLTDQHWIIKNCRFAFAIKTNMTNKCRQFQPFDKQESSPFFVFCQCTKQPIKLESSNFSSDRLWREHRARRRKVGRQRSCAVNFQLFCHYEDCFILWH